MELLGPAGNLEKLKYAYEYGADAAYIGLKKFSLRVKADNFYEDEYKAIQTLKAQYPGKKLHCALNISFHNKDIDNFLNEIDYFKAYPIDAFIVQDIGMVNILKKHFPNVALHVSTQANCINREAVKVYRDLGFARVVLGREASLAEVKEIKDAVPEMELECFAHGAMCISYSGRCLMSAYLTGRSANAGFCSHSCRWNFNLGATNGEQLTNSPANVSVNSPDFLHNVPIIEMPNAATNSPANVSVNSQIIEMPNAATNSPANVSVNSQIIAPGASILPNTPLSAEQAKQIAQSGTLYLTEQQRPNEHFPVFEGDDFTAILSSKDLCMIDHLADLKNAGVDSLKIEGRMKSLYYVSMTVRAYRKALDALDGKITQKEAEPFIAELYKAPHREFATGFFYNKEEANKTTSGESFSEYELAATIGKKYSETEAEALQQKAVEAKKTFDAELEAMHPDAKVAKLKDLELHPEKAPIPLTKDLLHGKQLFCIHALNRIDSGTWAEYVGPSEFGIADTTYTFVDSETGFLTNWTSHNHEYLLLTDKKIEENWIMRVKSTKVSDGTNKRM